MTDTEKTIAETCSHNLAITNFHLNLKARLKTQIEYSKCLRDRALEEYPTIEDRLKMDKDKAKYIAHHHATMREAEAILEHSEEILKQMLIYPSWIKED